MKTFAATLVSVFVAAFVVGCDSGVHTAHDSHAHSHEQHAAAVSTELQLALNAGERWQMDDHTRKMMVEMEAVFAAADHLNQVSLNTAGKTMSRQIEELVVGCTMEGKAHEQLHIFLGDYIPAVNALASAESPDTARELALNIHAQLDNYKKHFR